MAKRMTYENSPKINERLMTSHCSFALSLPYCVSIRSQMIPGMKISTSWKKKMSIKGPPYLKSHGLWFLSFRVVRPLYHLLGNVTFRLRQSSLLVFVAFNSESADLIEHPRA